VEVIAVEKRASERLRFSATRRINGITSQRLLIFN